MIDNKLPSEVQKYYNKQLLAAEEDRILYEKAIGRKLKTSEDWGRYAAAKAVREAQLLEIMSLDEDI